MDPERGDRTLFGSPGTIPPPRGQDQLLPRAAPCPRPRVFSRPVPVERARPSLFPTAAPFVFGRPSPGRSQPHPGLCYPALQAECVLDFYSCPVNERSTLTLRFTWRRWKNTEAKTQITCQPTPKIKKPHYSDSVCHLLPSLRYIIGFTLSRQRHILSCR